MRNEKLTIEEVVLGLLLLVMFITVLCSGVSKVYNAYEHNKGVPIKQWQKVN